MRTLENISSNNLPKLVPLYENVFNFPPWNDGWSPDVILERLVLFSKYPHFLGLALFEENIALGMILGWSERWTSSWHFHIKEMCVLRELQREGIGEQLLTALENKLSTQGVTTLYLETRAESPAQNFYTKHGFTNLNLLSMKKRIT